MKKIIRSRAPLRIGLAGGGTDVSPYSDIYGGAILNATINLFAYTTIEPRSDGKIILSSIDMNTQEEFGPATELPCDDGLVLIKGVYNRIIRDYIKKPLSFKATTYVDAPPGSGLGTSSTLVVSILGAFTEWLKLPFGEYDLAHLAYGIERSDLAMAGGRQDQYAATFGGFNFIEFNNDRVIVNPLRVKQDYITELEFSTILYYTGTSRLSARIIEAQSRNVKRKNIRSIEAMHKLKEQAYMMKDCILTGDINAMGELLDLSWHSKKQTAVEITSPMIDEIYDSAKRAGATGGKISGAGGGGFMIFYCPRNTRYKVIETLKKFGGEFRRYQFLKSGLITWRG